MNKFDEAVKDIALFVREKLAQVEEIHSLDFEIAIDGRVHDGEIKIEYKLGNHYGNGGQVKGGKIDKVVSEYLHRFGWDQVNTPLALSYDGKLEEIL